MSNNNERYVKRLESISQLAKDLNEIIADQNLIHDIKYKESMYCISEILRTAVGLLDEHDDSIDGCF